MSRPEGIVSVGWTCPTISRVQSIVRKLGSAKLKPHERAELTHAAVAMLEEIRTDNEKLRANAALWARVAEGAA